MEYDRLENTYVLSTIASNYDLLQINCVLLNRARMFAHSLICNKDLDWDDIISRSFQKESTNICNQLNASPKLTIDRFVGARMQSFTLIGFVDASVGMVGMIAYICNNDTGKVNFLHAKNSIISNSLEGKSIPAKETQDWHLASPIS